MEQESSCIVVLGVPCQFALQHSGFLHCAGTVWELRSQVRPQHSCQVRAQGLHGWSGIIFSLKLCMYRKSLVSRLGLFSFFFVFPFQFFFFFVWLQQCASFLADQLLCFNIDDSAVGLPRWLSISHCAQTQGLLHAISTRMFTSRFWVASGFCHMP